tara:strand:- start:4367 stop:6256 length:1890 start_codon:yes stop_codon:yes gene_type:complete
MFIIKFWIQRCSILLGILAFMCSCAPSSPLKTVSDQESKDEKSNINERKKLTSARELYELAKIADETIQDRLFLESAVLYEKEDDYFECSEVLRKINSALLSDANYLIYGLLKAKMLNRYHDFLALNTWMSDARLKSLVQSQTHEQRATWINLIIDMNISIGNSESVVQKAYKLTKSLPTNKLQEVNNKIWVLLNHIPLNRLIELDENTTEKNLSGWLQLAIEHRFMSNNNDSRSEKIITWKNKWPRHPAAIIPPVQLTNMYGYEAKTIALLLPMSDSHLTASKTLLDGFLKAYYRALGHGDNVPLVKIYDTTKLPVQKLYPMLLDDGAEMIIGPARNENVQNLLEIPNFTVPVMTLHRGEFKVEKKPQNFFQFGLSALDEMDQIAQRAWLSGKKNVLTIAPEAGWGSRASDHFEKKWLEKGGVITDSVRYSPQVKDFITILKKPLNIDASDERGLELLRYVNSRLKISSRRRQDIDLVVIVSFPSIARQIKPSLDFLYAADLPIYATSHIYNGTQQISLDNDLSGIEFCAMPWTLANQLPRGVSPNKEMHTALKHFYVLGYDAFSVSRHFSKNQQKYPPNPLFAATGVLDLIDDKVKRKTGWAKFKNGKVTPINFPYGSNELTLVPSE